MSTIHDNEVQLNLTGIKIKDFKVTDYSITSGQPYEGVTIKDNDKIVVKAGRHGSTEVAEWFKKKADTGVVIACDTMESYPSKLNFAIFGNLTFEASGKTWSVKNLLFAQGHNARSRNNWWTGGPSMTGGSVNPLIGAIVAAATVDGLPTGKVGFIAPPLSVSHFDLITVSVFQ